MYAPHTAGVNIVPVILVCLFIPPPPWNLHGSAAVNIVPVILVCLFITPPPPWNLHGSAGVNIVPVILVCLFITLPPPMEPSWFGWCEYSPGDFSLFIYNPPPMEPSGSLYRNYFHLPCVVSLEMRIRTRCGEHQYGFRCHVVCRPPAPNQHYYCDFYTGFRICEPSKRLSQQHSSLRALS